MKYKEDLRIVRTRKHLSTTIINMMQAQSLDKISVIDICKEACVNRATFYAHYEDKYHLLSYALEELKDDIYSSINKELTAENPMDTILEIACATFDFVKDNKGKISALLTHNRNEKVIQTIKDSLSRTVKQYIQKCHTTYPSGVPLTYSGLWKTSWSCPLTTKSIPLTFLKVGKTPRRNSQPLAETTSPITRIFICASVN